MRRHGTTTAASGFGVSDHVCWAYGDDDTFPAAALPWINDGLELNQRVMYVADGDPASLRAGLAALTGLEVADSLASQGRLVLVPLDAVYRPGGVADLLTLLDVYRSATREALADGYSGLRVLADGTPLAAPAAELPALAAWEHLADRYMSDAPMAALCAYDRRVVAPDSVATLCSLHPVRYDPEQLTSFALYRFGDTVAIEGEVDAFTAPTLERALRSLPDDTVVVDVEGLRFADTAGLTVLADYAARPHRRTPVEIRRMSGMLRRCWTLLGFDEARHP